MPLTVRFLPARQATNWRRGTVKRLLWRGMRNHSETVRVAAVSDIHYGKSSQGSLLPLFREIGERADILVLAGDLTDYGLPEEAQLLVRDLHSALKIPVVAVLGNHDFESGRQQEVTDLLCDAGINVL